MNINTIQVSHSEYPSVNESERQSEACALVYGRRIWALHAGQRLNENHESSRLPRHHLRRPCTDMDPQSLLKPFKKLKHRLARGSRKRDGGSGSESNRGERETNVEGSQASGRTSHLHSEVDGGAVGSGPSLEGNGGDGRRVDQAHPPTSTPSVPHDREPDSM